MSFIHMAGFDNHGNNAADFDRYDSSSSVVWSSTLGKYGGGALRPKTGTNNIHLTVTTSPQREGWATFYFQRRLDSGVNAEFIVMCDVGGFPHFWLEVGNSDRQSGPTDHQIILVNRDDTLLGTSINTFEGSASQPGDWVHLELWWKLGQGDGAFKLWAEGVLEIDVTGLTIGNVTNLNDWRLWRQEGAQGFLAGGDSHLVDDLVIQNINGLAIGVGHRIYTALPNADGAIVQWNLSTGSDHYALVDDSTPDHGSTYIESSATDDRDEFTLTAPTVSNGIRAVAIKALCTRASGSGNIRLGVDVGGSELISSAITVDGSVYKEAIAIFATPPGGGIWSQTDLDNLTIIVEATTANVRVTQVLLEVLDATPISESAPEGKPAAIRYFPCTPDEPFTFAADYVKDVSTDASTLDCIITEYDGAKLQVGSGRTILQWLTGEDSSRKQTKILIGADQATDALRDSVRFISFNVYMTADSKTNGLNYWQGWVDPPAFGLDVVLSEDGDTVDMAWTSEIPTKVKFLANTTGFKTAAEVDATGAFTKATEDLSDTEPSVATSVGTSQTVYVSSVPYDKDDMRSGPLLLESLVRTSLTRIPHNPAGATPTIDWAEGPMHGLTLEENITTLTLSNPKVGEEYIIITKQDGVGGWTLAWPSTIEWAGGSAPTISSGASAKDWYKLIVETVGPDLYAGFILSQDAS